VSPQSLDVWLLASNTVYRGVPFAVAAGWAEQGRLSKSDKVRPAGGMDSDWIVVQNMESLADYLYGGGRPVIEANDGSESYEKVEIDPAWPKSSLESDDEVDMIPLIDISLVLLIFFMMTSVVSSMSPVQVPGMKYGTEIDAADGSITILIERDPENNPLYSIQIGKEKPRVDESGRGDRDKLLALLDQELTRANRDVAVRIACHELLPRSVVGDLCVELQKRVEKQQISRYSAEVNEKKK
jgi:biopolymer transport protein ExbD